MKGVVVCPQPRAADAGAAVLKDGGTAFDAALAAAFAQMICDPFMHIQSRGPLKCCGEIDACLPMISICWFRFALQRGLLSAANLYK